MVHYPKYQPSFSAMELCCKIFCQDPLSNIKVSKQNLLSTDEHNNNKIQLYHTIIDHILPLSPFCSTEVVYLKAIKHPISLSPFCSTEVIKHQLAFRLPFFAPIPE